MPVQLVGVPKEKSTVLALIDPNVASMSSEEIADLVGSRHDNVKITIERLVDRQVIHSPAMQEKSNSQGRPGMEYVFSGEQGKRDSIIVVAQLSPEFTAALLDCWQSWNDGGKSLLPQGETFTMSTVEIRMLTGMEHDHVWCDIKSMANSLFLTFEE